jgi:hypothetical protein
MMQNVCKAFTLCVVYYRSKKLHNIGFNIIYTISGKQNLDAEITKKPHESSVSSKFPLSWATLGAKDSDNTVTTVLPGHAHHLPHDWWKWSAVIHIIVYLSITNEEFCWQVENYFL